MKMSTRKEWRKEGRFHLLTCSPSTLLSFIKHRRIERRSESFTLSCIFAAKNSALSVRISLSIEEFSPLFSSFLLFLVLSFLLIVRSPESERKSRKLEERKTRFRVSNAENWKGEKKYILSQAKILVAEDPASIHPRTRVARHREDNFAGRACGAVRVAG